MANGMSVQLNPQAALKAIRSHVRLKYGKPIKQSTMALARTAVRALRDGHLSGNETVSLLGALARNDNAIMDTVAYLFGVNAKEHAQAAAGFDAVRTILEDRGLIDTGDFAEDLRRGAIFSGNSRLDAATLGIVVSALLAQRLYVVTDSANRSILDRVMQPDTPAMFQWEVGTISNLVAGVTQTTYTAALMTHIERVNAVNGEITIVPITTAFPAATDGAVFPPAAAGLRVFYRAEVAPAFDFAGLAKVFVTLFVQGFDSTWAKIAPLFVEAASSYVTDDAGRPYALS